MKCSECNADFIKSKGSLELFYDVKEKGWAWFIQCPNCGERHEVNISIKEVAE